MTPHSIKRRTGLLSSSTSYLNQARIMSLGRTVTLYAFVSVINSDEHIADDRNNGLTIPQIGFGTWQSAPGEVEKA